MKDWQLSDLRLHGWTDDPMGLGESVTTQQILDRIPTLILVDTLRARLLELEAEIPAIRFQLDQMALQLEARYDR